MGKEISLNGQQLILSLVQDISNGVAIEQAVIKSELRNQVIMKIVNDGIWDWHLDTNLVLYDERYYTMAGYE